MIILEDALPPPELPQMVDGIIDIAHIDQMQLVAIINQYESMHIDDVVTFHLGDYLCSAPTIITSTELQQPNFQQKIPFNQIVLGQYKAYYSVYSYAANIANSVPVTVTIKNSNWPTPPTPKGVKKITAEVISNGAPASGFTANQVRVAAVDEHGDLISGIPIQSVKSHGIQVVPNNAVTDSTGYAIFSAFSHTSQVTPISFTSGSLNVDANVYFTKTKQANAVIIGRNQFGEYEVVTFQLNDKETLEQISHAFVFYSLQDAVGVENVAQAGANPETRNPVITDDQGCFKLIFKTKPNGYCTVLICANNSVGKVKYQK